MALWLSWLERRPVTAEVTGSNPVRVVCGMWLSLAERCVRDAEAAGSSPVIPMS